MKQFELVAEARNSHGRNACRRLRRAGKIPAVLYGAGAEPRSIQLDHDPVMHQAEDEAFYSRILTLKLDNASERVVLKDMQRHPFRALEITHLDLLRVSEDEALTMRVPIHFLNEDKCIGVKASGGLISHNMTEIEIICLPKHLPEYIEVDVAELDVGDVVHIRDVKVPDGVSIALLVHGGDGSQAIVAVQAPRAAEDEVAEGGAAAPAEGAPAAGTPAATPTSGAG